MGGVTIPSAPPRHLKHGVLPEWVNKGNISGLRGIGFSEVLRSDL